MKIILIGDSGHGKVVTDCVVSNGGQIVAKLDDKYEQLVNENGVWIGPVSKTRSLIEEEQAKVIIAIGSNEIRRKVTERLSLKYSDYATVIHEQAVVSESAEIGVGTVVMPGAVVNADAIIGSHTIINTRSVVEHDCHIDDFSHVSPGANITGGVVIEEGVHIGAGATVIPLKTVGQWSVIGAGSSVIRDIDPFSIAVGVPASVIKKRMQDG